MLLKGIETGLDKAEQVHHKLEQVLGRFVLVLHKSDLALDKLAWELGLGKLAPVVCMMVLEVDTWLVLEPDTLVAGLHKVVQFDNLVLSKLGMEQGKVVHK